MGDIESSARRRLLCAAALGTLLAVGACQPERPSVLLFDRLAASVGDHVFPSDEYLAGGVLAGLTDLQLDEMPFLLQLAITAQTGWAPGTSIRLPVTPASGEPDRWVDPDSAAEAVRLYDVTGVAAPVGLGDVQVSPATQAILARPTAPLAPGTYGVLVVAGRLRTRDGAAVEPSEDYRRVQRDGDEATDKGFLKVAAVDPDVATRADSLAYFELTVRDTLSGLELLRSYVAGEQPVVRLGAAGAEPVTVDLTPFEPAQDRGIAAGGAQILAAGPDAVAELYAASGLAGVPLSGIGRVVTGLVSTPVFVSDPLPDPNALPFAGTFLSSAPPAPFGPGAPLVLAASHPFRALPYLAVFPVAAPRPTPPQPTPVVVALHTLGQDRSSLLTLAAAVCSVGHALVAIDLYQHGARREDVVPPEGDFQDKLDVALAAVGVAFPDPFVNPTFLGRTRDKLRQSLVDALAVVRLLAAADGTRPEIDLDGDGAPDLLGPVRAVGHGLGAMVAAPLAALTPAIDRVALLAVGGSLPDVLRDSGAIAPSLNVLMLVTAAADGFGLMAGSDDRMITGTPQREVYDIVAETILAPVDPLSVAAHLLPGGIRGTPARVLVQIATSDEVVPVGAAVRFARAVAHGAATDDGFPWVLTAGQDPAAPPEIGLGLPLWDAAAAGGVPAPSGVTVFDAAGHGFPLDFADPAITAAAQTQIATFLAAP